MDRLINLLIKLGIPHSYRLSRSSHSCRTASVRPQVLANIQGGLFVGDDDRDSSRENL